MELKKDKQAYSHPRRRFIEQVPENVAHWHSASALHNRTHIAITNFKGNDNVIWLQPVSGLDYDAVNKDKQQQL
jgi:ribosomal protein S11